MGAGKHGKNQHPPYVRGTESRPMTAMHTCSQDRNSTPGWGERERERERGEGETERETETETELVRQWELNIYSRDRQSETETVRGNEI